MSVSENRWWTRLEWKRPELAPTKRDLRFIPWIQVRAKIRRSCRVFLSRIRWSSSCSLLRCHRRHLLLREVKASNWSVEIRSFQFRPQRMAWRTTKTKWTNFSTPKALSIHSIRPWKFQEDLHGTRKWQLRRSTSKKILRSLSGEEISPMLKNTM